MILRSPLLLPVLLLALAGLGLLTATQHADGGPSVQECQSHIDAALQALQQERLSPDAEDEADDVTPVHTKETNDLHAEDDDEIQSANVADDTQDDDEETNDVDDDEEAADESKEDDETEEEHQQIKDDDDDDDETHEKSKRDVDDDDEDDAQSTQSDDDDVKPSQNDAESEDDAQSEDGDDIHKGEDEDDDDEGEEEEKTHLNEATAEEDDDDDETAAEKAEDDDETAAEKTEDDDEREQTTLDDDDDDEHEQIQDEQAENVEADDKDDETKSKDDDVTKDEDGDVDEESDVTKEEDEDSKSKRDVSEDEENAVTEDENKDEEDDEEEKDEAQESEKGDEEEEDGADEEEVLVSGPGQLRSRDHINRILELNDEELDASQQLQKVGNDILKELRKLYDGAVKPLEQLYQFKDISNRLLGDAEIFSKPMVVFMGPWSTGKSAIINYLLGTEYSRSALKTGAEPTSNIFNVIVHGEHEQVMDGTQLAADWAFSSLQKFGQGFLDRLRGRKINSPVLRKLTIVDTPGILENRKSSERLYPFNDAFQWFIDRADLIYIVFDPTKLDIGLEMEALFDQLKGRESQVRILLNKADTVKPQELMKVQGNILWNLSPLLGTVSAPTIFVGSFWSKPYLAGSPATLFDAQEEAFLEDISEAVEGQVDNKVALTRRHAVRVRNHAKMVDCYLNTYYNHKTFFSNKRQVANDIVDNPQNYHIYEGMSTLTNVSRYDLPDPDIYKEFFSVHPLFDFKPLASTCSYFKGCPLDKLDITIAYDLPELVGKYHRILSNRPPIGGR